jgi:hypothetical protein
MMSLRAKALVMRKRSYYLSKQQHRQLRFMFAVVLVLPIFAIGALVFIFPDILDLGGEGYRKLLGRTWQNMKAEPLELTLFGIFGLLGLLQLGYVSCLNFCKHSVLAGDCSGHRSGKLG